MKNAWFVLAVGIALGGAVPALANGGGGGGGGGGSPGGSLAVEPGSTVKNDDNNNTYTFGLRAVENSGEAGQGDVVLGLSGPSYSTCTIHGDEAQVDFSDVGNESGISPGFQCGRAYGENVRIDGCTARIQAHAFQHSDAFFRSYFGTVPMEIVFQRTGQKKGKISVTTFFASGSVQIQGNVIASTPITMTTCNWPYPW